MSVIIRLQNLPWSANALDIRQFFQGLSIPEGGVHIVGGELGDAFIAFSTDEDARQAFNRNGGKIKEIQIKLMLSSRTEMQKVIEAARNPLAAFMQAAQPAPTLPPIIPAVVPAAVPEIKKEELKDKEKEKDRRSRRRSRSRSRDRKDRSRDRDRRDRRRRERSRSRSRDRRDRRRRERSRSRDRTRSKERDRRSKDRKRSEEKTTFAGNRDVKASVGIWEPPPVNSEQTGMLPQQPAGLMNNFMGNPLEDTRRNMATMKPLNNLPAKVDYQGNGNMVFQRTRESWPPSAPLRQENRMEFQGRANRSVNVDDNHLSPISGRSGQFNRMDGNIPPGGRPLSSRPGGKFHERQGPPVDRHQSVPLQNSCVQLRPFYGGYGEIRRFFQGLFINNTGIKFVNDEYGKRTGIVYIRFFYPEDKELALTKDGGLLRGNVVEVKHLEDEVFNETIDRYVPDDQKDLEQMHQPPSQSYRGGRSARNFGRGGQQHRQQLPPIPKIFSCLVVEDLPNYAKEQDILKMFGEYPLMSILMVNKQRRHFAYVKFSNPDDAKKAQNEKQKQAIDGKSVTVRPCADEEFEEINREQNNLDDDDGDDDVQIVEEKEFPNIESNCISINGLPLKTTDRDIIDFFSDIGVAPEKIHLLSNHLGFTGTAFCEFSSLQDAAAALEKDGIPLGPKEVSIVSVPKEEMESRVGILAQNPPSATPHAPPQNTPSFFPRNNFGSGPRGPGMGPRGPGRRYHPQMLPPVQHGGDVGVPGCTVLMENVPYKAGLDEILQFFEGFDIPPDNVLRRYNENGTPSGEAKVIFNSPDEAFKAVEQNRFQKIRERTIYLTLC